MFSGKHDNSVIGVANKDYDAAAIANEVMFHMFDRHVVDRAKIRSIYKSETFPTTGYGYAHNLDPALVKKIKQAFFTFPWEGSALKAEFKERGPLHPDLLQEGLERDPQDRCRERRQVHLQVKGIAWRTSAGADRLRTGDLALKDFNIDVPDGEVMALIGPSGAGKSTVIRCINRLVEPTAGRGHAQRHRAHGAQRPRTAPRAPAHWDDLPGIRTGRTAHGDGKRAQRPARLCRLLAKLHAQISASRHRGGIPAAGARRPRPGGRQACRRIVRRPATAGRHLRALIQNPDLLLVDEPTASLDPETSRQIMRLIKELCAERRLAAIINIHDVMLAQMFAERIVGLRHGEIVYDGAPSGLAAEVLAGFTARRTGRPRSARSTRTPKKKRPPDSVIALESRQPHRDRMAGLTLKRCVADRTSPLEEAAADQTRVAALDHRHWRRRLSGAGAGLDRMNWARVWEGLPRGARFFAAFFPPTSPAAGARSPTAYWKASG